MTTNRYLCYLCTCESPLDRVLGQQRATRKVLVGNDLVTLMSEAKKREAECLEAVVTALRAKAITYLQAKQRPEAKLGDDPRRNEGYI